MKLAELEATFIGEYAVVEGRQQWRELPTVEGAQGIMFYCPKCQNHMVLVPFANPRNAPVIPQEAFERIKFRWTFSGETLETVSITPSVDLSKDCSPHGDGQFGSCDWHGWVTNGVAE